MSPLTLVLSFFFFSVWKAAAFLAVAPQQSNFARKLSIRANPNRSHVNTITNQRQLAIWSSSTSLNMVWWFGGTPGTSSETSSSGEECELVAVRIDRTSPNSRRISGEIIVDTPLADVWAILTDYDNLATHVPNLVASKRISGPGGSSGEAGNGMYECRLYQRGSQKIVGFEFGADVTMDMKESIIAAGNSDPILQFQSPSYSPNQKNAPSPNVLSEERRINFKCVDSQFFSEFDGTWQVVQLRQNSLTGEEETKLSYTVDVRPKGPVPVAALEWRIREDVPTNLRAVKRAATEVGYAGVMASKNERVSDDVSPSTDETPGQDREGAEKIGFADFILDYENETLGAYLE